MERTGTLVANDGTRLFYRQWPASRSRGTLHLVHGLGEHSGRYGALAEHLNALGITVRAHDLRGHGRSDGARAAIAGRDDLLDDLKLVLDDFARAEGQVPFLLGHSLGGLIAAQFATRNLRPLRGLLLSSPALAFDLPVAQRWMLTIAARWFPKLSLANGLDVTGISHDPQVIAAYRSDPLIHDRLTPGLAGAMLAGASEALRQARTLDIPVLLLVAGDDRLVAAAGSRDFFGGLPPGRGTLHGYDGAYHELFNELPVWRDRVLEDLTCWLGARLDAPDRDTDRRPAS